MKYKGVFFDLVGTLLIYGDRCTELSEWYSELYACLKRHGLSISKETFIEHSDDIMIAREEPHRLEDGLTVFERRIRALCSDLGVSMKIREIKDAVTPLLRVWQKYLFLDPDCISVLELLQQEKTLALVTNFDHPPWVHAHVQKLGLEKFFTAIVISGEVGIKKPDPRIFGLALQRTGLHPEEVVYVGDTEEDIACSLSAGIVPILIQRARLDQNGSLFDFRTDYQSTQTQPNAKNMTGIRTIGSLPELIDMLE